MELLQIGEAAVGQLSQHQGDSVELKVRVSNILAQIEARTFQELAKNFLIDSDPLKSYGLPCWQKFSSVAGSTRASKSLFLEMIRQQRRLAELIEKADTDPSLQQTLVELAAQEGLKLRDDLTLGTRSMPKIGDAVGLLMCCSAVDTNVMPPIEVNETLVAALRRHEVTDYFRKPGYHRSLRAIAGKWVSKTQFQLADNILEIAMDLDIPDAAEIARKHLDASSDEDVRVLAFQCLSRFGNTADLRLLEPLLTDDSVLHQFEESLPLAGGEAIEVESSAPPGFPVPRRSLDNANRTMVVRVSDLALVTSVMLAAPDSVREVFEKFRPHPIRGFDMRSIAFPREEVELRKQAVDKWQKLMPQAPSKSQ